MTPLKPVKAIAVMLKVAVLENIDVEKFKSVNGPMI
jgi:hypothetical protein